MKRMPIPIATLISAKISTNQDDFAPIESVQRMRFDGKQWNFFGEVMGK